MENTNKFEDEIDFKDVMTNPKRWFGFYYLLLIVGIVLGGVYYLKNINNIYINSVNNSVYLPDSVNVDESAQFMIDAAKEELIAMASEKSMKIEYVAKELKSMEKVSWMVAVGNCKKIAGMLVNNSSWKGNRQQFINMMLANIGNNGVKSDFTELSSAEVDMMYNTFLTLVSGTNTNA